MNKLLLALTLVFVAGLSALAQEGGTSPKPSATPAAEKVRKAAFTPNKDQIMQGQKFLKEKNLFTGDATGKYDAATRASIRTYQKDNGLDVTGNFNKATLEKMGISTEKASSSKPSDKPAKETGDAASGPKRPAPFRAGKDQVASAQKILRDGKMLTGGEDGKLDDPTREALGKYQEANSLKVTKTLNAATLTKMGIALTDKQKQQVAAQAAYDAAKPKQ